MRQFGIILFSILLLTVIFTGCGGGKSSNTGVTQVVVSPTGLSMNSGDVVQISAIPENASGAAVANVTATFGTANNALVTVSPTGLVCAGVWQANFITCNGNDSSGNPLTGSTTITASAGGITSAAVPVTVHLKVTSVVVDTVSGCTSTTQQQKFTAHACSTIAQPHDANPPCGPAAKDVTSVVGSLTWGTLDPTVATVDTNGLVTAVTPGFTGVFASASNTSSSSVLFTTCMPIEIRLHEAGQPVPTGPVTLTQGQAITLQTDMTDANNFTQSNLSTIIASDFPAVAGVSTTSLTGSSFGGAGITAGCSPPTCGKGFNAPVYSNLFPVTIAGSSPAPMVYATSSFTPPSGTSPTLIPIDTSKSPPTVGTAITLPGVPNSMVFAANGSIAYLGTNAGLVSFSPSSNAVNRVDSTILGKVLAVSADGSLVIASNAVADPQGNVIQPIVANQRLWIFKSQSGGSTSTGVFVKPAAAAAAINSDNFRAYIATNDNSGNVYVFSSGQSLQTITIPEAPATGVAFLPSGPFAYIAAKPNAAGQHGLNALATCSNLQKTSPPTHSDTLQQVQQVPGADMVVAVDSSGVDVVTANVTSILSGGPILPFNFTATNCQPNVSYSNQFLDFGVGAITANQLLVASNGSKIAVLPSGNANILTAVPGSTPSVSAIPLAGGGTQALSGGITPDGSQIWVGVAGTNKVDGIINGTDSVQVPTSFQQPGGGAAPPDIVAVQPK
jgi:hypothetical protein